MFKPHLLGLLDMSIGAKSNRSVQRGIQGQSLPIGSMVVPFRGWYLGSYKVIPKWNYYGAYG